MDEPKTSEASGAEQVRWTWAICTPAARIRVCPPICRSRWPGLMPWGAAPGPGGLAHRRGAGLRGGRVRGNTGAGRARGTFAYLDWSTGTRTRPRALLARLQEHSSQLHQSLLFLELEWRR